MNREKKIVVTGSGLGGLPANPSLRQRGCQLVVHRKNGQDAAREIEAWDSR